LNQDWERPVNIEFYDINGEQGLNQQAGVKIFGGCSRTRYPQKSLGLYARGIYGEGSFNYQLFPDKPIVEFETFILRTSADDQVTTMFRDALAQAAVSDIIDVDVQAYRPVVVYINGEYWGIHNIREKLNEHYPAGNYNLDADSVDVLKRNPYDSWNIVSGSPDHYLDMMSYINSHNMSNNENYEYVSTQMDVAEYINYQITEIHLAADDWPGNNIKFWRSSIVPNTSWRWMLYDLDWTFIYPQKNELVIATEIDCGCSWPNPPWSTLLFRKLLENADFTAEFLQSYALYMNTVFQPGRLIHIIDSLQAQIAVEIPRHINRWGGQLVPDPENWISPTFASVEEWEQNVEVMRNFAYSREPYAAQHLLEYFGLSGMSNLAINLAESESGQIAILQRTIPNSFSGNFFNDTPISIEAIPEYGYEFDYWLVAGVMSTSSELISTGAEWKYLDTGSPQDFDWTQPDFDDSDWSIGQAELGYGDGDEMTLVEYGPDPDNKYITTYFRHEFNITEPEIYQSLQAEILRDDGAVLYLNGSEIARSNMPDGYISYNTTASDYVSGDQESTYYSYAADPDLLIAGSNILAVEIHQSSPGSSDISFNLALQATIESGTEENILSDQLINLSMSGDIELTAFFTGGSIPENRNVVINEINYHPAPDFETGEWIELTNAGSYPVNLNGWQFKDSDNNHIFEFDQTSIIPAGEFLVLCRDTTIFREFFPLTANVAGNFEFGLSGSGELIRLFDDFGILHDEVEYDDNSPWPTEPDGYGATLELTNPYFDNTVAENWQASIDHGSPGYTNSQYADVTPGDLDQDGFMDVLDIVLIVGIIVETIESSPYMQIAGDMNNDGLLNVMDVVLMVDIIIAD